MTILTADGIQLPSADDLRRRIHQLDRDTTAARQLLRLVMKLERRDRINDIPTSPADPTVTRLEAVA